MEEKVLKHKTALGMSSVTNLVSHNLYTTVNSTTNKMLKWIFGPFLAENVRVFEKIWQQ
jgi:hypothetical protein